MPLALPQVQETFQKLIDAGKDLQRRNEISAKLMRSGPAHGFPSPIGILNVAPFDAIGDTMRGTKGIVMDMFRHPDKLLEAIDVMTRSSSTRFCTIGDFELPVGLPAAQGGGRMDVPEAVRLFYWPSLKKVMDALINEESSACSPKEDIPAGINHRFPQGDSGVVVRPDGHGESQEDPGRQFLYRGKCPFIPDGHRHS